MYEIKNFFKSVANKEEWKTTTKKEKEIFCSNYSTYVKLGFDIPDHLEKYHKNWCNKKK